MKVILFATGITVLFRLLFEVYHPPQPQPTPAGNTVCVCVTGNKEAIMFITLRCFRHLPSSECRHFCFLSVRERKIFFFLLERRLERLRERDFWFVSCFSQGKTFLATSFLCNRNVQKFCAHKLYKNCHCLHYFGVVDGEKKVGGC